MSESEERALAAVGAAGSKPGRPGMSEDQKAKIRAGGEAARARKAAEKQTAPPAPHGRSVGTASAPAFRPTLPSAPAVKATVSAEAAAVARAKEFVDEERLERERRMEDIRLKRDPSKRAPSPYRLMMQEHHSRDLTALVYADGRAIEVPEGHVPRWVRTVDHMDRAIDTRVGEILSCGGHVAQDPGTGEPVKRWQHVLTFTPIDGYARRTQKHLPTGALEVDRVLDEFQDQARHVNRTRGRGSVTLHREAEHGRREEEVPIAKIEAQGVAESWAP